MPGTTNGPRMEAEYEENDCKIILKGGLPFLVLNFEKYAELGRMHLAHCDVVYVMFEDDKCTAFLVELKNIAEESTFSEAIRSLDSKFKETEGFLGGLLDCMGVRNPNYRHILVLPQNICDFVANNLSLVKRILGTPSFPLRIVPCGCSIFDGFTLIG